MLEPLRDVRVWRFGLYYVVVFGAYVAFSLWLPGYYQSVYKLPLANAALLTALFIFPASLLRPLGGWLSDRYGAAPSRSPSSSPCWWPAPGRCVGRSGLVPPSRSSRCWASRWASGRPPSTSTSRPTSPPTSAPSAASSARWARSAASSCRWASPTSRRRPASPELLLAHVRPHRVQHGVTRDGRRAAQAEGRADRRAQRRDVVSIGVARR